MDPSHHQMDSEIHWQKGDYQNQNHHSTSQGHQMLDLAKRRIRTQLQNCVQYQGGGHDQLQQETVHPNTHMPPCDANTSQHDVTFSPSHPRPPATQDFHTLSAFVHNGDDGQGHTHQGWQQTHAPHMNTQKACPISQTQPHTHPEQPHSPYTNHPDVDPQGHPETVSSQPQCSPLGYGSNAAGWGKWSSLEQTSPCVKDMSNPTHPYSSPNLHPRLCQSLSHYPHSLTNPSPITESLGMDSQLSNQFNPLINEDQSHDSLNNQAHMSPQPYPDPRHPSSNRNLTPNLQPVPQFYYPHQPNHSVLRDQLACDNPPDRTTHHLDGTSGFLQSAAQVSSSLSQPPLLVPGMRWGTGMGSGPALQRTAHERRGGHVNGNLISSSNAQTQVWPAQSP